MNALPTRTLLAGVLAAGLCLGGAVARAYDPRLDEALAALQKAAALVEASATDDSVSAHTLQKFEHEKDKALVSIQDAMDHIVAAGLISDSDSGF